MSRWLGLAALLAILLVAFGVRVVDLAGQSFWWDEAYSTLLVEKGLSATFQELRVFDFHPPLHYLVIWTWIKIAGRSEFALRFVSVVAGCLSTAIAIPLGQRLFAAHGHATRGKLASGLVFAFAPFLVYYSREARMYGLTALWVTLALYCLHRALYPTLSDPPSDAAQLASAPARANQLWRWRYWAAYAGACLLGVYTFYYFVFIPIFGGAWVIGTAIVRAARRDQASSVARVLIPWLGASVATTLAYLPWLPVLLGRNAVWDSQWASTSSPVKIFEWSWVGLVTGLPNLKVYDRPEIAGLLAALALALAGGALIAALGRKAGFRPTATRSREKSGPSWSTGYLFALLAFLLPLAGMAAVAMIKPVFHPRYALPVLPGLLLAFAGLLAWRPKWRIGYVLPASVGALLAAAFAYGTLHLATDPAYARDNYRGAVAWIQERLAPTDTIIYNTDPGFRYYYRGAAPARFFPGAPYEEAAIAADLNALSRDRQRLWYLRHSEVPTDPEGIVERQLAAHARKLEETWFGSLRLTLYQLPTQPEFAAAPIQPAAANFGNRLRLIGYAISGTAVPAGGKVDLALRWQVLQPGDDLGIWVGLADDQGAGWGRADSQPRDRQFQLSSRWLVGETVTTHHDLPALIGTPPGSYQLSLGVYRLSDRRGLDLIDAAGRPSGQSYSPASVSVDTSIDTSVGAATTDPTLPLQLGVTLAPETQLAAAALETTKASPGGSVKVTLLWRQTARTSVDYIVALRIGAAGAVTTRPAAAGRYPTSHWRVGELVRDQTELRLPQTTPAGPTTIEVGLLAPGAAAPAAWAMLGTVEVDSVQRVFAEPAIANRIDLDLGARARLLGYKLEPASLKPGANARLTLYWQALADGDHQYRVFTHLLDANNKIWAQRDGEPKDWTRPTSTWLRGEIVEDTYDLPVQPDTPPGSYEIEVGMYDPATSARLAVTDRSGASEGDRIVLGQVRVSP